MRRRTLVGLSLVARRRVSAGIWAGAGITEAAAAPVGSTSVGLNVGTELSWERFRPQLLRLYQQAGVGWLRVWYNWASLEQTPGHYEGTQAWQSLALARKLGFRILFVIWGTPFGQTLADVPDSRALTAYCRWLRSHFGDVVDAWEVGNEPNLPGYFRGSPAQYVVTLAAAYSALGRNLPVVAAGPSGGAKPEYWQALFQHGLERYCDRVNLHPYRGDPQQVVALVQQFRQLTKKPLWITEIGLSADRGEIAKARFLTEALPLLTPLAERIFWYRGVQGDGLHPLRFGLVVADRQSAHVTPLPAYHALTQLVART